MAAAVSVVVRRRTYATTASERPLILAEEIGSRRRMAHVAVTPVSVHDALRSPAVSVPITIRRGRVQRRTINGSRVVSAVVIVVLPIVILVFQLAVLLAVVILFPVAPPSTIIVVRVMQGI